MLDIEQYLLSRQRPDGKPAMYQRWRQLTFLHFACDPRAIQALLPKGLTVDTFPNPEVVQMAWIGLVPFEIANLRFPGLPPIPGISRFPETNVRTYVHKDDKDPGVWFFSLDAANTLACRFARLAFGLPYFEAKMSLEGDSHIIYRSRRRAEPHPHTQIRTLVGDPVGEAEPGSLEFFLVERYRLYAHIGGELLPGRVHHQPYALHQAKILEADETLVESAGLKPQEFEHVLYSPEVSVEVFALEGR